MSALTPKNYIEPRDLTNAKRLPIAVVLQKKNDITVYRIESGNANNYFESFEDPIMIRFKEAEEVSKRMGKKITKDEFLDAAVFPAHMGSDGEGNEFIIYRAKFKEKS